MDRDSHTDEEIKHIKNLCCKTPVTKSISEKNFLINPTMSTSKVSVDWSSMTWMTLGVKGTGFGRKSKCITSCADGPPGIVTL